MIIEARSAERIREALRTAGVSNFELIPRDTDREPDGFCVQFSFVEGHVCPDDACRFLTTLVQSTLPDLQVYNSRTWSDTEERVVCICTRPRCGCDAMILLEQLGPIHAAVRCSLYEAGIISSPNIHAGEWPNYQRDRHGRFGFRISVDVVRPTDQYGFPRDLLLTVTYEPQGRHEEQERRVAPLLFSIRESLVETGSFRYVLAAAEQPSPNGDSDPHRVRRSQLGFNVSDVGLLREERRW